MLNLCKKSELYVETPRKQTWYPYPLYGGIYPIGKAPNKDECCGESAVAILRGCD